MRPIEMDNPHILAWAAETGFCNLKYESPLHKKIPNGQTGKQYLSIGSTFDPTLVYAWQSL